MQIPRTLAPVVLLLVAILPCCSGEAGAAGNPSGIANQLEKVLSGITDTQTAESAKSELTTLTDQLAAAIETAKSAASDAAKKAEEIGGGEIGKMAGDLAGKAGDWLSPQLEGAFSKVSEEVERLLSNAEVQAVLGPVLDKLKGLVAV